jgi:hypothetical protein
MSFAWAGSVEGMHNPKILPHKTTKSGFAENIPFSGPEGVMPK